MVTFNKRENRATDVGKLVFIALLLLSTLSCKENEVKGSGHSTDSEPSVEELALELESVPLAPDGPLVPSSTPLAEYPTQACLDTHSLIEAEDLGYQLVIVVDKGADKQSFTVYSKGEMLFDWPTSTGQELKQPVRIPNGKNTRKVTPTGVYSPIPGRLHETYFSRSYQVGDKKVPMPYAVFFVGGVAFHQTNKTDKLGSRDSGGCVRLHPYHAPTIFDIVKNQVGMGKVAQIDSNGCIATTADGKIRYKTGYRTLIVVKDSDNP